MNWFKFSAYNTESQFGYGTQEEAIEYLEYLNEDREINQFQYETIRDQDSINNLNNSPIGFLLQDQLECVEEGRQAWREW